MELNKELFTEEWQKEKNSIVLDKDFFKNYPSINQAWPEGLELKLYHDGSELIMLDSQDEYLAHFVKGSNK